MLILTTIFLTQYNLVGLSFAQNSTEPFGLEDNKQTDKILVCEIMQYCTNPKEVSNNLFFSEKNENPIIKPITANQNTGTTDTVTTIPDVTSNISLIITPDIVNPLANEDNQVSTDISEIRTDDNTTLKDIKDKVSTNSAQNNNNNSKVLDVITPSNTNQVELRNNAIITPTTPANTTSSGQGNATTSTPANTTSSGQGNATTSTPASQIQITPNPSQVTNINNTTNKITNSSADNEEQIASPTAFPMFDQIFKFFGAR
ncbi:MAG: hypothetical protein H0X50_04600 [Nitrosopumilus sp.]|nr:hypothetical protein [Nitrosopumilus sp.]